jgi:hypothetical protein
MTTKPHTHLILTGIFTGVPPGTSLPAGKYVFQKTVAGLGNITSDRSGRQQVRRWVRGTPTNTPLQQPQRARFARGVAAWHALSPEQKEAWRVPSRALGLNRFQGFMRTWCRTEPIQSVTVWDNSTTAWTGSGTIFDTPETNWDSGATEMDSTPTIWL